MLNTRALLLAITTATLSLVSCREATSPRSALQIARSKWAERGPSSYSVTVSRACFCAPPTTDPVVITVSDGVIVSRVYAATGDTVPADLASVYPDVASLFQILDDAMAHGAARVEVTYQADFGYPADVYIDYVANAADDEISYHLTGFSEPLM